MPFSDDFRVHKSKGTCGFGTTDPDVIGPIVAIITPTTSPTFDNGTTATVSLAGTAVDAVGVTEVTWSNAATGGSGTAVGTSDWSIASISLNEGSNVITVTARDAANNTGTDVISVVRQASGFEADFFVSTTGSASNPGTFELPWTLEKARTTLTAGQVAALRGGTYTLSTAFAPTNSGTAGNPITLIAYPGETPIIDRGLTAAAGETPNYETTTCFNFDGKNYWTLDGLEIKRGQHSCVLIAPNSVTTGIRIQNCNIHSHVTSDNAAAIYSGNSQSVDCVIHNNLIHDRVVGVRPSTGHGIIGFHMLRMTITNNEIYNVAGGIYHKHCSATAGGTIIRYNYLHDNLNVSDNPCGSAMLLVGPDQIIEHNLIENMAVFGIIMFEESSVCSGLVTEDNLINHNTIVNVGRGSVVLYRSGSCPGALRTTITNNVFRSWTGTTALERGGLIIFPFHADSSQTTFRNNCVSDAENTNEANVGSGGNVYSIGALPGTVTASGNIDTAPTFTSGGGFPYALATGSAGENAALDGTDMGCDFSLGIGPQ